MLKSTLHHYYPGNANQNNTDTTGTISESYEDSEATIRRLYREITDLKVRNEFLEQSLQDSNNGLLSDGKLLNDYQELKTKVESQQAIIDNQNEMLDEAQSLLQQLRDERDSLKAQLQQEKSIQNDQYDWESENQSLRMEVQSLQNQLLDAHDQIDYFSQQSDLPLVPEVSDEETDYSFLQEELQGCLSWIIRLEGLLNLPSSTTTSSSSKRLEEIYNHFPSRNAIIGNSYLSLIQTEINELYVLVEGKIVDPSAIKQIHVIQERIRSILSVYNISSLIELSIHEKKDGAANDVDDDWNDLYKLIIPEDTSYEFSCKDDFVLQMKNSFSKLKKKEEELLRIIGSLKKECTDSLHLNRDLYVEYDETKKANQLLQKRNDVLSEKAKKIPILQEKYRKAVEEIKQRGILISQYQQDLLNQNGSN